MLSVIGDNPLAADVSGGCQSRIATIFPYSNVLVTVPGIHATQRLAYIDVLNQQRLAGGQPALTESEQQAYWDNSVDLIVEDGCILIRPDPDSMDIAFKADELLQELVPKRRIKFLHALNEKIRNAIKRRGENWRIATLPTTPAEMKQMIASSRAGIGGCPMYYYSKSTGTHFLTCQDFVALAEVDDQTLRAGLMEIGQNCAVRNRFGHREVDFFLADKSFSVRELAAGDLAAMDRTQLRAIHQSLARQFRQAVKPEFYRDDLDNLEWRNQMFAALVGENYQVVLEDTMLGLSPEFFMQIQWLPGSRIEQGELIPDSVFEDAGGGFFDEGNGGDEKPRGFIFNLVREYGDLEYVNIGRVNTSLSRRALFSGRRGVYIVELKVCGAARELVRIIRMQKWGVREHLDEGKDLLRAMIESEKYTEYILDRRLGCRQLGMNLPPRIVARRVSETYHGRSEYDGSIIWSAYFERDYIQGIATDKLASHKVRDPEFSLRLAELLGRAAAPNLIVGRADHRGNSVFDDGDELVIEDGQGMPSQILISDPTGTFVDYGGGLDRFAADYARPVNSRAGMLPDPAAFTKVYVDALVRRFLEIQQEYRKRRQGFDTLFKLHRRSEVGSFPYRWQQILLRLDQTDPNQLGSAIRSHVE